MGINSVSGGSEPALWRTGPLPSLLLSDSQAITSLVMLWVWSTQAVLRDFSPTSAAQSSVLGSDPLLVPFLFLRNHPKTEAVALGKETTRNIDARAVEDAHVGPLLRPNIGATSLRLHELSWGTRVWEAFYEDWRESGL